MERPPADPAKLLEAWMEWERGETPPGRVMSTLKTGGLRQLLEQLAAGSGGASSPEPDASGALSGATAAPDTGSWTPQV